MKKFSVAVLAMLLFVGVSFAGNQSNDSSKFGLGYSKTEVSLVNQSASLDTIAGRFWFSEDLGIDVSFGFRTGDAEAVFLIGAKMVGKIIKVNKLDIYWLAGLAFGSYDPKEDGVDSISLFRLQGGVGAEYYLLPCLSLLTEMGVEYFSASANGTSNSEFGVFASWLPQAGVRFYFN